ncbi:MAG: KH domain-containing protein [Clostridia bacterium]|nr:KH domain-containing protein [Clostridia bacterium]
MKEILQTIIEALVEEKAEIKINEIEKGKEIVFEVRVADKDMGRVIGKEGRIAKSIRTIFKAVGTKEQKRVTIEFID